MSALLDALLRWQKGHHRRLLLLDEEEFDNNWLVSFRVQNEDGFLCEATRRIYKDVAPTVWDARGYIIREALSVLDIAQFDYPAVRLPQEPVVSSSTPTSGNNDRTQL